MRRLVEYRNLTFASSDDGVLQIWFEARCNEDNLLVRIYGQDRDTVFERITPQVLTGWALYRPSNPKGLVSGIYAFLRPHGSGGGALTEVEQHLRAAKEIERQRFLDDQTAKAVNGVIGIKVPRKPLFEQHTMRRKKGGKNAE
ncbi:hypothetical protein [Acetobacter senegalensis]|uniref:hypothetical protein n=1 Tax=Acetobacter senegalensis TaxID=446692 RepID=UPI0026509DF7|nr:hypothetical protein [Acetobacter senegalensis]MDN7351792.1 hypothetical protein [Acetobacter senegalensis]